MKKHLTFTLALFTLICTSAHAQLPSYLPTDGLVGWWPFNGNANDESGNGNHGVVNGATLTEDRFGNSAHAYSFDGVNDFIGMDGSNLSSTSFSLSGWFYTSVVQQQSIYYQGTSEIHFGQFAPNNNMLAGVKCSSNSWFFNNEVIYPDLNTWTCFTITFEQGSSVYLYLNGILVGQSSIVPCVTFFNPGLSSSIGAYNSSARWFNGLIDDIAIYNRALSEQEIQNLYTATNSGNTVDTGNGAAPLPQGIPYQAAARDGIGQPVVDSPVNVRFSLHEGAADGATSYIESHSLTTNSIGLFNTVFGNGTPEQSAFDSINWAATTKFLQVEVDLGNGYVDMGTTQLLSVPYAFRSAQAANIKNAALPIYPDNAAALAGGLVAGEMYRTATGDLKIVY